MRIFAKGRNGFGSERNNEGNSEQRPGGFNNNRADGFAERPGKLQMRNI